MELKSISELLENYKLLSVKKVARNKKKSCKKVAEQLVESRRLE